MPSGLPIPQNPKSPHLTQEYTVIHTKNRGALVNPEVMRDLSARLAAGERLVAHFHGGLVPEEAAREKAARLAPLYAAAGAHPVFFVWESAAMDILRGNLSRITSDPILRRLVEWVTRFAVAKTRRVGGAKGGLDLPTEIEVKREILRQSDGHEPFSTDEVGPLTAVTDPEREEFERRLAADYALQEALHAELRTRLRGDGEVRTGGSVIDAAALAGTAGDERTKGVGTVVVSGLAALALGRVIKRRLDGRDHGLYPTVVEEVLRALFLSGFGGTMWSNMKGETRASFDELPSGRAGFEFVRVLSEAISAGVHPQVTLVGHSTGAVFINYLLEHIGRRIAGGDSALGSSPAIGPMIFLAPACSVSDFARVLPQHGRTFHRFRTFGLSDERERADALLPGLYPRSLLYFVSGVLERDEDGNPEPDAPILGMERFISAGHDFGRAALPMVRDFLVGGNDRAIWSPSAGTGVACTASTHGGFDLDGPTVESIQAILREET